MHNSITSIQEVARLSHLRILKCSYNRIADLSWVAQLQELQELWVHHNLIETPQIAHLQSLSQLQTLVLHPNPCTELSSYMCVSFVLRELDVAKALPWLDRLDTVVVDQELRDEAQHASERDALSTGSTEYSLSSLSGRSDGDACAFDLSLLVLMEAAREEPLPQQPVKPQTKKEKQLLAEEFMRNFPVQDYIPVSNEDVQHDHGNQVDTNYPQINDPAASLISPEPDSSLPNRVVNDGPDYIVAPPNSAAAADTEIAAPLSSSTKSSPAKTISSITSAVLSLPTFSSDGFLKKHAPKPKSSTSVTTKKKAALLYPNTTTAAIHIRSDGSAVAKWPNGTIAVSVDRERDGFRVYAVHKDGQIALSFDASGVGFANYYPSGKVMVSTTSSGDSLYFSSDGFAIVRQWDAELNLKDEHMESTTALGNEPDGALLCKLSDGIGIRLRLGDTGNMNNPIRLSVYFASTSGIRHVFHNRINVATPVPDDASDCVFGKELVVEKVVKKQKEKPVSHADLLSDIRAAVAHLLP
ncbi:hypothetical protein FI667_g3606, partial [Globisporangium splendens]